MTVRFPYDFHTKYREIYQNISKKYQKGGINLANTSYIYTPSVTGRKVPRMTVATAVRIIMERRRGREDDTTAPCYDDVKAGAILQTCITQYQYILV